jgi:hypothetical protein
VRDDDHGAVGLVVDRHAHPVELGECLGAQHAVGRAGGDDDPLEHQGEAVAVQAGEGEVVHRRDDREAVLAAQA